MGATFTITQLSSLTIRYVAPLVVAPFKVPMGAAHALAHLLIGEEG